MRAVLPKKRYLPLLNVFFLIESRRVQCKNNQRANFLRSRFYKVNFKGAENKIQGVQILKP